MSSIFISYRRADSAGYAGRIYDHLSQHFGVDQVFMDVTSLEPGVDFVDEIDKAVSQCDAVVVVIGKQWVTITDSNGHRRLDNPNDFVRLEVETALNRNILTIPVLVDDAPMPYAEELPPSLAKLVRHNALEVSNARFTYDVDRLIHTLDELILTRSAPPQAQPPVERFQRSFARRLLASQPYMGILLPSLLIALGWGIAIAVSIIIQANYLTLFSDNLWLPVGIIGGAVTALVLWQFTPMLQWKHACVIAIGWIIGCTIRSNYDVFAVLGISLIGALGTTAALLWAQPQLGWRILIIIFLAWSSSFTVTYLIFFSLYTNLDSASLTPWLTIVWGFLGGFIGAGITFWQLRASPSAQPGQA